MTAPVRPLATRFDPVTVPIGPGVALVEASAGTGKTFGITMTVIRLLLARQDDGSPLVDGVSGILVVTFTEAATNELISRVRQALRDALEVTSGRDVPDDALARMVAQLDDIRSEWSVARLHYALAAIDTLSVFTIHGFCKRILDEFALESGTPFGATLLKDESEIVQAALEDWWRRTMYPDATLAALAVERGLTPSAFRDDFLRWSALPSARLEPGLALDDARAGLQAAIAAFRAAWDAEAALGFLNVIGWTAKSALSDAASRARLVARATDAANGDVGAAVEIAAQFNAETLMDGARKRSAAEKAARDTIPLQPFVAPAAALGAAVDALFRALRTSCLGAVRDELARVKADHNALGFNDLLVRLRGALEREGSGGLLASLIRRKYQAALIDEFQDTDPNQFPIFRIAFEGMPLFLVGDPKQAIYGFRGADVFAYIEAATTVDRAHTLDRNFRSTGDHVSAVNALFARAPSAFLFEEIPFAPSDAQGRAEPAALRADGRRALHWCYLPAEQGSTGLVATKVTAARENIARTFVNEIIALLQRDVKPGDIAILVRTGYEGRMYEELLREARVPAVVSGLGSILESVECTELALVLRGIATPRDTGVLRAALATELWGATHDDLQRWASDDGESDWDAQVARATALLDRWAEHGFMEMMQQLLRERQVIERWLALEDGERRLTNLRHIMELLHDASASGAAGVEGVLHWLDEARATNSTDADLTELRLETDAAAVQIVTVHKSKGLEYGIVFCPSLWSTRIAKDDAPVIAHLGDDGIVFDHGSELRAERGVIADRERLAEDLRLAYVALTRARYRTYVAWGPIAPRGGPDASWRSALAWLLREPSGDDGRTIADAIAAAATALSSDLGAWETSLAAFVSANDRVMSCETITGGVLQRWSPAAATTKPVLAARAPRPGGRQFDTWSIASFTALTSTPALESAHDRDDGPAAIVPVARVREDFAAFPAGRQAGVVLHALFERANFAASAADLVPSVAETLMQHGLAVDAADSRVAAVAGMMERVCTAPITDAGPRLADVPYGRTLREWEFLLPLGDVDRGALASVFAAHGGNDGAAYAPFLRQLSPRHVHGFLTGFVDLVFEHGGRWYVVDWKSNQLGADPGAYGPENLRSVMHASHYTLQYHLYVTALHRFLRARVPGYTYVTHMGGAAYAFLRGFTAAGHGWYVDRPAEALILALDAIMESGRAIHAGTAA